MRPLPLSPLPGRNWGYGTLPVATQCKRIAQLLILLQVKRGKSFEGRQRAQNSHGKSSTLIFAAVPMAGVAADGVIPTALGDTCGST